jgi:lipopolysaccharide transport system permease protein
MLAAYMLVFGYVFPFRWSGDDWSTSDKALMIFSGMIVHQFYAECLGRSPTSISMAPNLVKKVVFPLEVLPLVTTLSAAFHALISMLIMIAFYVSMHGSVHPMAPLAVVAFLPMLLFGLGICWLFGGAGVFVRDLAQIGGVIATMLLFLSPVFYPVSAVPTWAAPLFHVNPLTSSMEQIRGVLILGTAFPVLQWCLATIASIAFAFVSYLAFQRVKNGFADVL